MEMNTTATIQTGWIKYLLCKFCIDSERFDFSLFIYKDKNCTYQKTKQKNNNNKQTSKQKQTDFFF